MKPQEKAEELINNFIPHTRVFDEVLGWENYIDSAKQCALIVVNEILDDDMLGMTEELFEKRINYWNKVKQEIQKL